MVCLHRQGGGGEPLQTFCEQGEWGEDQFFAILCGRLLWTAPKPNIFLTKFVFIYSDHYIAEILTQIKILRIEPHCVIWNFLENTASLVPKIIWLSAANFNF